MKRTPNKPNYMGKLRSSDIDIEALGRETMAKEYCNATKLPTPADAKELLKDVDAMYRAKANQLVPGSCP